MKKYETKEMKIVKRRECVELKCDLCERTAEYPDVENFDWCNVGAGSGTLAWNCLVGGDYDSDELDLCYDCAAALGEYIENPSKRQQLLTLIGRERKCD
ncbi:MAG: hypothetical protein GY832_25055 [Chloroflexi bacterium]|nr:hypothetical protein [Chloroflexota bacterium]